MDGMTHQTYMVQMPGHPTMLQAVCGCIPRMEQYTGGNLPVEVQGFYQMALGWIPMEESEILFVKHRPAIDRQPVPSYSCNP